MYSKFKSGDKVRLIRDYVYNGIKPNVTYTVSDFYIYFLIEIIQIKDVYDSSGDIVNIRADYMELDTKYLRKQKLEKIRWNSQLKI